VNPKDVASRGKAPLHLLPGPALVAAAEALRNGAEKYGPYNWRKEPILASTYISAAERHLRAWYDGENDAPDSGIDHLAHALAGLMILVDARACGAMVDDRPPPAPTGKYLARAEK
jgi:hypothetical protein